MISRKYWKQDLWHTCFVLMAITISSVLRLICFFKGHDVPPEDWYTHVRVRGDKKWMQGPEHPMRGWVSNKTWCNVLPHHQDKHIYRIANCRRCSKVFEEYE